MRLLTRTCLDQFRKLAFNDAEGSFMVPAVYGAYPKLLYLAKRYGREQLSAAVQTVLEEVTCRYVAYYVRETGARNLVLAGGVCANVKLNQRLFELAGVENIFVFPHMADGGLGYGRRRWSTATSRATGSRSRSRTSIGGRSTATPRSGPPYSVTGSKRPSVAMYLPPWRNCFAAIRSWRISPAGWSSVRGRWATVPSCIRDGCQGERLAQRALKRSEFMPFAPVTLAERASESYLNLKGAECSARFMTVTFDCTSRMIERCPAVVHVDGTARPQLITEEINPRYYRILDEYWKRTGIASIVNTSFQHARRADRVYA